MTSSDEITYIRPLGLISGVAARSMCDAGQALPLAGGPLAFTHGEALSRDRSGNAIRAISELGDRLVRLSEPRGPFAGIPLPDTNSDAGGKPLVMGILNVTPDSFFDGGKHAGADAAIAHGRAMHAAGADIIDIGGESTRPGAAPVTVDEELGRVMPVVAALANDGVPVSIDTRRAPVMAEAIATGARVVNDVTALRGDCDSLAIVAASGASVILMHMQGAPETMQSAPRYDDVVLDVYDALVARVAACEAAGIARSRICIDPGIGFGKTAAHSLELISSLAMFHGLGCAVAIGVSRKSFIDALVGPVAPEDRLPGSLAAMLVALGQGVQIVRVHDVGDTVQAISLWRQAQEPLI